MEQWGISSFGEEKTKDLPIFLDILNFFATKFRISVRKKYRINHFLKVFPLPCVFGQPYFGIPPRNIHTHVLWKLHYGTYFFRKLSITHLIGQFLSLSKSYIPILGFGFIRKKVPKKYLSDFPSTYFNLLVKYKLYYLAVPNFYNSNSIAVDYWL